MTRSFPLLGAFIVASALSSGKAAAQVMTACDWEAAHPSDPYHVGPGVSSKAVDTARAIVACEEAVAADPEEPRFHYQLGRAKVYAADRAQTDWTVGLPHLEKAAEMGHVQGMFVLGLMHERAEEYCEQEDWTKKAAEAGLKSARISYVNHFLAGRFADCDGVADGTTMSAYLDAAGSQISGWYENMLMEALQRELAAHLAQR